jgi:hypothetical protein
MGGRFLFTLLTFLSLSVAWLTPFAGGEFRSVMRIRFPNMFLRCAAALRQTK